MVRTRLSSPALALATMPWKYPPGDVRKCSAGLAETSATATAAHSRPIAKQAQGLIGERLLATAQSALALFAGVRRRILNSAARRLGKTYSSAHSFAVQHITTPSSSDWINHVGRRVRG